MAFEQQMAPSNTPLHLESFNLDLILHKWHAVISGVLTGRATLQVFNLLVLIV